MKKFDITVSLGIIILCVLIIILVGLHSIDGGGTPPSYRFIAGRNPIKCEKANKGTEDSKGVEDKRYLYSFEADFNDICSKADAELIPAGFVAQNLVIKILSGNEPLSRMYWLKRGWFPRELVWIQIYKNIQYEESPNSKKDEFCEKEGWVTIEVVYGRGWRWPF